MPESAAPTETHPCSMPRKRVMQKLSERCCVPAPTRLRRTMSAQRLPAWLWVGAIVRWQVYLE